MTTGAATLQGAGDVLVRAAYETLVGLTRSALDSTVHQEALMELYAFCDDALRGDMAAAARPIIHAQDLAMTAVDCILSAMRCAEVGGAQEDGVGVAGSFDWGIMKVF